MNQYSATEWAPVFSALVGASAALTGLLFVALSINLAQVIKAPGLIGRAVEVLILLVSVLILATLLLVPNQGADSMGSEIVIIAALEVILLGVIHIRAPRRALGVSPPLFAMRVIGAQSGPVVMIVGGATILAQAGGGLYWIVPGMLAAMVAAVIGAWVMLVEIVR